METLLTIGLVVLGAALTYIGTIIHFIFDKRKEKEMRIKQLKIEVYTKTLSDISEFRSAFDNDISTEFDIEIDEFYNKVYSKYSHKLKCITVTANLIANAELQNEFQNLILLENEWLLANTEHPESDNRFNIMDNSRSVREVTNRITELMRKEIYS